MKLRSNYNNLLFLVLIFCISPSCSTKKKSWAHRQYHNTSARFNGYFNGNESIKLGIKKLHNSHIDDYTTIIPVFPTGDLKKSKSARSYMDKAIQKGSIVIQRHSIKIKGKEYCKWIDDNYLMVGKAYFYKGEFDEAIKTFKFINNSYKDKNLCFESSLWLVRGYVEKRDFVSAEAELKELLKTKKTSKKLNKKLALVASDFYVKREDFLNAKIQLLNATKLIKSKRKKVRLNYILAQIYQQEEDFSLAKKYYKLVLRSNSEYDMAFNAKMNVARLLEAGNSDRKKTKERLLKMVNDDKNKEYLDQIYYTIAEMEMNNSDTVEAVKKYKLSTIYSVENNPQKSLSFLALGEIYFEKKLYKSATTNYDSTIFYMDPDFRLYKKTKKRQEILSDLVYNINIVEMQDSLQMLAKIPEADLNNIIRGIIQELIDSERQAEEEKRMKQKMMYEGMSNRGRDDSFGRNTSGGKWYFYNPATLSFGLSEFRKKWGSRKLEDDWRRKDKKTNAFIQSDSTTTDTTITDSKDVKKPGYYLSKLPKTKEDFELSNLQIKEALYQIASIYKNPLNEITRSSNNFNDIFIRFPYDEQYAPLALYNMYLNYKEIKEKEAEEIKEILLKKYPNSIYVEMVNNPNSSLERATKKDLEELAYEDVFNLYQKKMFDFVIEETQDILDDKYKNKKLFLRALSFIQINEIDLAIENIKKISEEEDKLLKEARYILESIEDPSKMEKANELAVLGSPYMYRKNQDHMIVLVLPKNGVDVTYLKTLISEFHTNQIGNEAFDISALLLGLDKHLLMIKSFQNANESMDYYQLFEGEKSVMDFLNKTEYNLMSISVENFPEFYKYKDVDGYSRFFIKNYTTSNY